MKQTVALCIFFLACMAIGCNTNTTTAENQTTVTDSLSASAQAPEIDRSTPLDSFYSAQEFTYLYLYPDSAQLKNYPFKGKPLSVARISQLPYFITNGMEVKDLYHGVYKIKIDNSASGFITRQMGYYVPSVLSMWVFNHATGEITDQVILADVWGDAGDAETKQSIVFYDENKVLHALTHSFFEHHPIEVEENSKDTAWTQNDYALVKITAAGGDTISKDNAALRLRYDQMLKEKF